MDPYLLLTNPPVCLHCQSPLTECPSCGDLQCRCKVPWAAQMRPADRRLAPRQHYDKQGQRYTRNPYDFGDPPGYDNLRSDEMLPL